MRCDSTGELLVFAWLREGKEQIYKLRPMCIKPAMEGD